MNGLFLIPSGRLIWRLITRGEQALFNLEIKKKSGLSINPDIHYSKVPRAENFSSENSLLGIKALLKISCLRSIYIIADILNRLKRVQFQDLFAPHP